MIRSDMTSTQTAIYKAIVDKVVVRCLRAPRSNWTLFECVVEEIHGGGPPPTKPQSKIIERAVHKSKGRLSHATKTTADTETAHELKLFIDNDAQLYQTQHVSILKNLATKKARSQYKHDLAVKLFGYLVESGAKKYAKEFGSPDQPWHKLFDVPTRKLAAEELTRDFEVEFELGNYDHLLPKKYQKEILETQHLVPPRHHARKKSGAGPARYSPAQPKSPMQLDRDIAESLASRETREVTERDWGSPAWKRRMRAVGWKV